MFVDCLEIPEYTSRLVMDHLDHLDNNNCLLFQVALDPLVCKCIYHVDYLLVAVAVAVAGYMSGIVVEDRPFARILSVLFVLLLLHVDVGHCLDQEGMAPYLNQGLCE